MKSTLSLRFFNKTRSLRHPVLTRRLVLLTLVSFVAAAALLGIAASASRSNRAAKARAEQAASIKAAISPGAQDVKRPNAPTAAAITATLTDNVAPATKVAPGGTINYTALITNTNVGPADDAGSVVYNGNLDANTTISGLVQVSPVTLNDTFPVTVIGNVSINSHNLPVPYSVFTNDYQGQNGGALTLATSGTTANGGQIVLNTTPGPDFGEFTYNPPPGFEGNDTFTYTLSNSVASSIGTVTIPVSGMVWFINNNAAACTTLAGGCGRLSNPFSTLAAFQALNNGTGNNPAINDNIFVFESATTYLGGVTLLGGQKFIGQDSTDTLATITGLTPTTGSAAFPAMNTGAPATTITNGAGAGITLNATTTSNTVRGMTVTNTSGAKISGANFGTLTVGKSGSPDVTLSGTGQAMNLTTGTFAATSAFASVAATSSTTTGMSLTSVGGTVAFGSTTTSSTTNQGIFVTTSAANINFGNTAVTTSGGIGVNLATNSGTATFGDLDIAPNSGQRGLVATSNSGALTNSSGTISATSAAAVEIVGLSAGSRTPLNLQFDSISANGSNTAANGLILTNTSATGAPGGFRVNGSGTTVGSGGTIQNTTTRGANINTVDTLLLKNMNFTNANSTVDGGAGGVCDDLTLTGCNSAIFMNGVTTLATLDNLDITGTMVENGITAINVANFKFDNSLIDGAGNEPNESGIEAQILSGTATMTNSEIRFSETDAFAIVNNEVSLNLTISNSIFRDSQTLSSGGGTNVNGEGGFQFRTFSRAALVGGVNSTGGFVPNTTINILNSSFLRLRTQAIQVFSSDDTVLNLDVTGCTIDAQADIGTGLDLNSDVASIYSFNVTGNPTIQSRGGAAVNITSFLTSHIEGRVNNNPDIEVLGAAGIPVRMVAQEQSQLIVLVDNNTVSNVNGTEDTDIDVQSRFQTARADVTITRNTVTGEPTGVAGINLIVGSSTAGESNITCGDIGGAGLGNTVTNATGNALNAFRVRVSDVSNTNRMFLEGFTTDTDTTWINRSNLPANGAEVAVSVTGTGVLPLAPPGGVCAAVDTPADFRPNEITDQSANTTTGVPASAATTPVVAKAELPAVPDDRASDSNNVRSFNHAQSKRSPVAKVIATGQQPLAPLSGEAVGPINIGTLPAGKSVTIKYAATVNAPPLAKQVSQQGTVTFTNGPGSPLLTDDLDAGGAADPTVTLIDTLMTWNGATNTDWNTATNWTPPAGGTQYAPGVSNPAINDVVIPNVGAQPNISATDIGIFSLNISNGRTLTITSPRVLTIGGSPGGDLTLDGIISGGNLNLGTGTHVINNAGGTGSLSSTNVATVLSGATVTLNNNLQAGALAVNAGGSMNITSRTLSLNGSGAALTVPGGATFTTTGSTVVFNGTAAQQAAGIAYNNLTINNSIGLNVTGVTLTGNATINGVLALTSSDLDTGAFTLSQPNTTASTGVSDVVGTINRTAAFGTTTITFGNPNNQITFGAAGSKPTALTVVMAKLAPATYLAAVQRNYTISQTGTNTSTATVRLHYLDAELNGNTPETALGLRRLRTGDGHWTAAPTPPTLPNRDGSANWVEAPAVPGVSGTELPTQWTFSTLAPTASNGTITGRILDDGGRPVEGAVIRLNGSQNRKTITDAEGNYHFGNVDTGGLYTVTPSRSNYSFNPFNRSFSMVGNQTEAVFTGTMLGDNANPSDTAEYFVRQQYVDILNREPDEAGFNYWSDHILACGEDAECIRSQRTGVAAAFFIENEFRHSGAFIYNVYESALGRRPAYSEYTVDRTKVVGGSTLDEQKRLFAEGFVGRSDFVNRYQNNNSADSFVDALLANAQAAGINLSAERESLIARYNTGASLTESRALVLRDVTESAAVRDAHYNAAFVEIEYFGYLHRNPDGQGRTFWLNVLNNGDPGNYRGMVCSFITSTEYQHRFSSVVSHNNTECGNQ